MRSTLVARWLFASLAIAGLFIWARSAMAYGSPMCTSRLTVYTDGQTPSEPECEGDCWVFSTHAECLLKGVPQNPEPGMSGPVFCKCGIYPPDAHCDLPLTYTVIYVPGQGAVVVYSAGPCPQASCPTQGEDCEDNIEQIYDSEGHLVARRRSCGCQ
jgi:hypothetical protein